MGDTSLTIFPVLQAAHASAGATAGLPPALEKIVTLFKIVSTFWPFIILLNSSTQSL